ncbi:MAG: BatD family protein [Pseudomonadota bacterium]
MSERLRGLVLSLLALLPSIVDAEVYTTVDRQSVQQNESFTLTVVADAGEQGEPDVSALNEHFEILGRSQSTSTVLINRRREQSKRWIYTLIPKAAGNFDIPSVSVDGKSSEPLPMTVLPVQRVQPGEADVFFEVSVDTERSWVQAQVVYSVKLYFRVDVRQTSLTEPRISGGEVIVEKLAEDRRFDANIGGTDYQVIERRFALFPQSSGQYDIAPMRFSATLWERGRITSPRVFTSEALSLEVLPAVAPPPELAGARWVPARAISLSRNLDPADGRLDVGEPASLQVTVGAIGLMANQLPELSLNEGDGLRVYPDQPSLRERAFADGVRSAREQRFAVIATRGGEFDLPPIELPWFNVQSGVWEVDRLDLPQLQATGLAGVVPPAATLPPDLPVEVPPPTAEAEVSTALTDGERDTLNRLRLTNYLLLTAWLVTLWLFWRSNTHRHRKQRRERAVRDEKAPFRATDKARKAVLRACQMNDARAAEDALLNWAAHYWPEHTPTSLGQIADRLPEGVAQAIAALNSARYGPTAASAWQGDALRAAMSTLHRAGAQTAAAQDMLPPLFPSR